MKPFQIKCSACGTTNPAANACSLLPPLLRDPQGARLWLVLAILSNLANTRSSQCVFSISLSTRAVWVRFSAKAGHAPRKRTQAEGWIGELVEGRKNGDFQIVSVLILSRSNVNRRSYSAQTRVLEPGH